MTAFAVRNGYVGFEISGVHLDGKVVSIDQIRKALAAHGTSTEIVGWRWKSEISDRWQYSDGPEKPELGFTPSFEKSVSYVPVGVIATPPADPWSTDLDAAPLDRKVLICTKDNDYFVAYRYSEQIKGEFCFGDYRGVMLICRPTKWREIPE